MAPTSPALGTTGRRMLFLFLDGVGLGEDDPERNPFASADMLNLIDLLEGRRLVEGSAPFEGDRL